MVLRMLILPEGSPIDFPGKSQVFFMSEPRSQRFEESMPSVIAPFTHHAGDAARALTGAILRHGEGTWEYYSNDSAEPTFAVEVVDALLVDLERPGRRSLLHRALLTEALLKPKELERLERRGLELQRCPGILCLEEGKLDPVKAAESIAREISADLQVVLNSGEGYWRGPLPRRIDSGLRGRVEIGLSPEQALLRSARQHGQWDSIVELPLLREVVSAAPSAFSLVADPGTSAEARSLLESAGGQQDLAALTGHRADPWRAFDRALELLDGGHLQFLSAIPLFQLGEERFQSGDKEAALRHWRRAEEKGLDDFDICGRIGQICAHTGRRQEALLRLRQHARKSTEQLRFAAAREAWTHLVCLEPSDEEAVDRAVQLWVKEPATEIEDCLELAQAISKVGRWVEVAELVSGVGVQQPDARLHEWHGDAARALGDDEMEMKALWRQAECLRTGDDPQSALPLYADLLDRGYDEARVSLRLAEIHLQQSNGEAATQVLNGILQGRLRALLFESEELQGILDSLSRFEGVPLNAFDFLFELAKNRGAEDSARNQLLKMIDLAASESETALVEYRTRGWLLENRRDFPLLEKWLELVQSKFGPARTFAEIESAIDRLELTPEQAQKLARRGVEHDPSHPKLLRLLTLDRELDSGMKAECYRRVSFRALADGGSLPTTADWSVSEKEAWRTPLLKLLFSEGARSLEEVEDCFDQVLSDPQYLQNLLLNHVEMDQAARDKVEQIQHVVPAGSPGRTSVVRSSLGGITEKLKTMSGAPQEVSSSSEFESEESPEPVKVAEESSAQETPKGIQSALDRLKALRQPESPSAGEASESETGRQEIPAEISAHDPPAIAPQPKVHAAIARLGALRNGGNLSTGVDVERPDP